MVLSQASELNLAVMEVIMAEVVAGSKLLLG
jgi:hypothetical protein